MVGRQVELARARAVWREAAAGRGGALLVRGEAGIGKTRLCEALLAEAAADGWTTLRGSGLAVGAYRDALGFVDQALATGGTDPELLALRADLAFATGAPGAVAAYAEAVAGAPAERRGPLLVRQARAHVAAYDPSGAAAALAAASVDVPADRALRRLIEAQVAWMTGDLDTCELAVEEARTMALGHGVLEVVFGAMTMRDIVFHQRGRWPEGLRHDLLEAGASPLLAAVVYDAHLCGAEAYLYGGRPYDEIKSFAQELAQTARRAGATRGEAFAVTLLGEAELLSGELGPAEVHLSDGVLRRGGPVPRRHHRQTDRRPGDGVVLAGHPAADQPRPNP
jgi:hypothetical protein